MGSWNTTCHLANYGILPGDKIRYLLLRSREAVTAHGPNDLWTVMSVPIKAEYGDYGRAENFDGSLPRFLEGLSGRLVEPEDLSHSNLSIEALMEALHREEVKVKDLYTRNLVPVVSLFISEEAWQATLKMSFRSFRHGTLTFQDYQIASEDFVDQIRKFRDRGSVRFTAFALEQVIEDSEHLFQFLFSGNTLDLLSVSGQFRRMTISFAEGLISEANYASFLNDAIEFFFVDAICGHTRKAWHPSCGAGSQDLNYGLVAEFHESMAKESRLKLASMDQ